ncbi:MAG: tetratricopeptide repeat protein [Sedimentisphaerales bacterium]|nr:tetratricopeptide repeat protein [Sedimentisphaerales bacterium]
MMRLKTFPITILFFFLLVLGTICAGTASTETAYDFHVSGNHLYHNGKYDEAIQAFEQCIRLEPDYYFARNNLGAAMAKNRDFEQALQQFTFCIDKKWGTQADRIVFYFNRALIRQACGQSQIAQKDWSALKKLDPIRAVELQKNKDYIFMDDLYSQRRNEIDRNKLFQENKMAISKGKIIVRKIAGHRDNAQEYEAMGLIEGTIKEVSGILTDYRSYPEFMPNVKEASIRRSTDYGFIVDYRLGLPMNFEKKYRLIYRVKDEANKVQLLWKNLPWPGLKPKETIINTWGQWMLETYPGKERRVLAYYRVYTDPGKIPLGFGWIVDFMSKDSIPNVIGQTRRRVKQLAESTKP